MLTAARLQNHQGLRGRLDATSSAEGGAPAPAGAIALRSILTLCVNQALAESGGLGRLLRDLSQLLDPLGVLESIDRSHVKAHQIHVGLQEGGQLARIV